MKRSVVVKNDNAPTFNYIKRRRVGDENHQAQAESGTNKSLKEAESISQSRNTNAEYAIGWICGITTEYVAAQAFLDEKHEGPESVSDNDNNDYTLGRVGKHNVVIAVLPDGEEGTCSAASVARDLLHSFPNVRIGLLVGVGGGAPTAKHDIRLGDVVVSASRDGKGGVFQYDFGKTVQDQIFRPTGFLNQPPTVLRTAVNGLKAQYEIDGHQLEASIETIFENKPRLRKKYQRPQQKSDRLYRSGVIHPGDYGTSCMAACGSDASSLVIRPERTTEEDNPAIHYGLIASANQLMNDALVRDILASETGSMTSEGGIAGNEVLCFEKEAAGLMNHFPCLVIRGICDYSDSHANPEWQGYAAMAAASYAKDLLYRIPPNKIEAERTIIHILTDVQDKVTDVSTSVSKFLSIQNDQEHQAVLDWFTPINYASQQHDFLSRRQAGTGRWFLDSQEYRAWLETAGQTLFCQGIPGSGKTIMTSLVVKDLLNRIRSGGFHDDSAERGSAGEGGSIGIAYLYCNFRRQHEQQAEDLFASLLKQLVKGQNCLPQDVQELYERHKDAQTRPKFDEISSALKSAISIHSRVFIIVDALDECKALNRCRSRFLAEIFLIQAATRANFFATSRPMLDIEKRFEGCLSRHIFANDEDVGMYVDGHISQLPDFVSKRPSLQEEVKRGIIKAVGGMFLLAQLHLDSLVGKRSPTALRATLATLPTGSEAYPEAYKEAMLRIGRQVGDQEELAKQALAWITCAKRPLTTVELQHGLAIRTGDSELDEDNVSEIEDIVSVCAGLVTVDRESNIIRLVHYTTQQYFEQTQHDWFPNAESDITTVCMTYLSFTAFETGFCEVEEEFRERLLSNQLYDYVARYWGYHSLSANRDMEALILHFLQSEANMSASTQVIMPDGDDYCFHNCLCESTEMSGIHLAAYFGLLNTVKYLLETGQYADCKDSHGRTPLWLAAKEGHDKVVSLLLGNGADPNPNDHDQRTPLWLAAAKGHAAVVKLLLENGAYPDPNPTGFFDKGCTPLWLAVEKGFYAVAKLLLEHGADPDHQDYERRTPLSLAMNKGQDLMIKMLLEHKENGNTKDSIRRMRLWVALFQGNYSIVERLLDNGADANAVDQEGRKPLWFAMENEQLKLARLLLKNGADANAEDNYGRKPLWFAMEKKQLALARLLLKYGADADTEDGLGRKPLWFAMEKEQLVLAELLLENGADANSKNDKGQTLLWFAMEKEQLVLAELLLENGADANSKNDKGQTLLWFAMEKEQLMLAELLLENGADANSKNDKGQTLLWFAMDNNRPMTAELLLQRGVGLEYRDGEHDLTPLLWAFDKEYESIIHLLLNGADLEYKDNRGKTPLSAAIYSDHEGVAKLLIERGSDLESRDNYGQTPLLLAILNRNESIVKLLIEKGADLESRGGDSKTPLLHAIQVGHEGIVKLLIEQGAALDSRNARGKTPIFAAILGRHEAIVELLVENGADLESKDDASWTPLAFAAFRGDEAIVKLLVDKGANLESEDDGGWTPLTIAAVRGDEDVVRLLIERGANLEVEDTMGRTPLSLAAEGGREVVVNLLIKKGTNQSKAML